MNLKSHPVASAEGIHSASRGNALLLKRLLLSPVAANPEREIVHRETRHTYRILRERIGRLATCLQGVGVEGGETVAVMDWDSHRYLEAYFAVPMMGAILMTVNVRLAPEQIAYTLNHCGARTLLVHADFLPMVQELRPLLESVDTFILIADGAAVEVPTGFVGEYERMVGSAAPDFEFPDFDENDTATTFYTTGTTGLPKCVTFSHRELVLHTLACMAALGGSPAQGHVHRDDVYMPMTPMFHVHAWGMPYVATAMGMKQVYPGRYAPETLLGLIANEKVTVTHSVPTLLQMLLAHPSSAGVDLEGLKMIIGGSALPQGLVRAALARGIDVFAGYGMSETGPVMTIARVGAEHAHDLDGELEARTRAGVPIPLVDLRIVDEQMRELPHDGNAMGEIVVRAPWLTPAYAHDDDASAKLWRGGWLHTNDIASIDEHACVRITDRMKDVIKTGGEWVSSLEIEDLVSRHPAVANVAVVGVSDARWGERPVAFVVPQPSHAVEGDEIRRHLEQFVCSGRIPRYAVPERVLVVDSIPKTSVGKPNKRALRERCASLVAS